MTEHRDGPQRLQPQQQQQQQQQHQPKRQFLKCNVILFGLMILSMATNFWMLGRQHHDEAITKDNNHHGKSGPIMFLLQQQQQRYHHPRVLNGKDDDETSIHTQTFNIKMMTDHRKTSQVSSRPSPSKKQTTNSSLLSLSNRQKQMYQDIQAVHKSQEEIQQHAAELMQQRRQGHSQRTADATTTTTNAVKEEFMSACLLVKDDNDLLPEWIAYHYHALKLRHVMIALDPSSQTSPLSIFQTWSRHTNLTFSIYTDDMYMPQRFLQQGYMVPPHLIKTNANESKWHQGHESPEQVLRDRIRINNHRFRQKTFVAHCIRTLRRRTKQPQAAAAAATWMMHIDTDEFVVLNPFLRPDGARFNESRSLQPFIPITSATPNSLFSFLQQLIVVQGRAKLVNYPCISMPRLQFGAVEDDDDEDDRLHNSTLPLHWNLTTFETLRWRYHTSYTDADRNGQPKVIVDISQIPASDPMVTGQKVFSIHRPSAALCRNKDQMDFTSTRRYPLTVNHYMGSWERYSARNDSRRSYRVSRNIQKCRVRAALSLSSVPARGGIWTSRGESNTFIALLHSLSQCTYYYECRHTRPTPNYGMDGTIGWSIGWTDLFACMETVWRQRCWEAVI